MKLIIPLLSRYRRFWHIYCGAWLLLSAVAYGQGQSEGQNTTINLGPVQVDLTGTFTSQYNSNITTSQGGAPDWILTPGVDISATWPLTQLNHISVSFGLGYQYYVHNPQLSSGNNFLNLSPDSNIQMVLLFGNMTTTLYDSVTYSTDATDVVLPGGGVGVANYGRFGNTLGANTTWDLNAVQVGLNLSRADVYPYGSNSATFLYTQSWTYTVSPYVGIAFTPNLVAGLQESTAWNYYKIGFQNNSVSYTAGPFMNWAISPVWSVNSSASYYWSVFSQSGSNGDTSQSKGLEFNISTVHIMNSKYQHRFFFNKSYEYGYVSNTTDIWTLGYSFQWKLFKRADLRGVFVYDTGKDSGGFTPENYNRYTADIGTDFNLTKKMTLSLDFQYSRKTSNLPLASYTQFLFSVGAYYAF